MVKVTVNVLLMAVLAWAMMGCKTLSKDEEQNTHKYSRVSEINRRMLAEDIERLLLLDKPSTLSPDAVPSY